MLFTDGTACAMTLYDEKGIAYNVPSAKRFEIVQYLHSRRSENLRAISCTHPTVKIDAPG